MRSRKALSSSAVTNRTLLTITGSDGAYAARTLDPGRYNVTFELTRFNKAELKDINVLLGQTLKLELEVAGTTPAGTVTESPPLIDAPRPRNQAVTPPTSVFRKE